MTNNIFTGYPDILNVNQICEMLGVSSKTIYRYIKNGKIMSHKLGSKHVFIKKDIISLFSIKL